jgi:hypothetical protein
MEKKYLRILILINNKGWEKNARIAEENAFGKPLDIRSTEYSGPYHPILSYPPTGYRVLAIYCIWLLIYLYSVLMRLVRFATALVAS